MTAGYISVFSAVVIGLAVADLATSFHRLMRHRQRVRCQCIHDHPTVDRFRDIQLNPLPVRPRTLA